MAALSAAVSIGNPALQARSIPTAAAPTQRVEKVVVVRAQAEEKQTRRAALALVGTILGAASLSGAANAVTSVPIYPPPPLSGGLPGTESADQARDFEAPQKERFYLQGKSPEEALQRIKESITVLPEVQSYITAKAWPYVRNELRSELSYLRYDLSTIINSKEKSLKKALNADLKDVIATIESLDLAARYKDQTAAQAAFDSVNSKIVALLAKLT